MPYYFCRKIISSDSLKKKQYFVLTNIRHHFELSGVDLSTVGSARACLLTERGSDCNVYLTNCWQAARFPRKLHIRLSSPVIPTRVAVIMIDADLPSVRQGSSSLICLLFSKASLSKVKGENLEHYSALKTFDWVISASIDCDLLLSPEIENQIFAEFFSASKGFWFSVSFPAQISK